MLTPGDLTKFVSTDVGRARMARPWSRGEFTYATNGHIMVRIPRLAEVPERSDGPDVESKVMPLLADQTETAPLPAYELPKVDKDECLTCNGRGLIHGCPDCKCKCYDCDGTGAVRVKVSIELSGAIYDADYIELLRTTLSGLRFSVRPPKEGPAKFSFDGGGVGAIMPMSSPYPHHLEIAPSDCGQL